MINWTTNCLISIVFAFGLLCLLFLSSACSDSGGSEPTDGNTNDVAVATASMEETTMELPEEDSRQGETEPLESMSSETNRTASAASSSVSSNQTADVSPPPQSDERPCVLSGNWSGFFYNNQLGLTENITAAVTFDSTGITITTSKLRPPGQRFVGTVSPGCGIVAIDQFDGEDWTTKFGRADNTQLRIADFVVDDLNPLGGTNEPPLNVIELYR